MHVLASAWLILFVGLAVLICLRGKYTAGVFCFGLAYLLPWYAWLLGY